MDFTEPEHKNGTVYLNPATCKKLVLMFIRDSKYGMLMIDRGCYLPGVPGFQFNKKGEFMFTIEELKAQFNMDRWVKQSEYLRFCDTKGW